MDDTTLSTISLLEARLLRIEHLLYGNLAPQSTVSAIRGLQDLEHRFSKLLQHIRVYGELLKLCRSTIAPHFANFNGAIAVSHMI